MTTPARSERRSLCDLFDAVGPDAPTLAGSWSTRDLAAHLVVRERRPDAAPGIVSRHLADYAEKVRLAERERPWPDIVARVREGPPLWNPMRLEPVDALANTLEFYVHHEDVRRAQPDWTPRDLPSDVEDAVDGALRRTGRFLARRASVGLVLAPDGHDPIRMHGGAPVVTVRGPVGECALYAYGRKDVARVTLDGDPAAVATIAGTPLGL